MAAQLRQPYSRPLFRKLFPKTRTSRTLEVLSIVKKLGSNPDLVIKPFDKGSRICLMNVFFCINKVEEHQGNPTTYKELSSDPTQTSNPTKLCTHSTLLITPDVPSICTNI